MKQSQLIGSVRYLIVLMSFFFSLNTYAQASADKLFREGKALQAQKNCSAQNKAIRKFSSAKGLYVSQDNKKKCDAEISVCQKNKKNFCPPSPPPSPDNIIKYIQEGDKLFSAAKQYQTIEKVESQNAAITNFKEAKTNYAKAKHSEKQRECDVEIQRCETKIDSIMKSIEETVEPVELTLSTNRLNFKRKPKNDMQTIRVNCNYSDWRVEHELSWITVFLSDHEQSFAVKAEQNPDKDSRFGYIYVVCGDKKVAVEVLQDGKKGLSLLIHNAKKNANL